MVRPLLVIGIMLFSITAVSEELLRQAVCKKEDFERSLTLFTTDRTAPCRIAYEKEDDYKKDDLWSAQNDLSFCELKFYELLEDHTENGWECDFTVDNSPAAPQAVVESETEVVEEPPAESVSEVATLTPEPEGEPSPVYEPSVTLADLDKVYETLKSKYQRKVVQGVIIYQEALANLTESHKLWLNYTEAHCKFIADWQEENKESERLRCVEQLTVSRIEFLKVYLEN